MNAHDHLESRLDAWGARAAEAQRAPVPQTVTQALTARRSRALRRARTPRAFALALAASLLAALVVGLYVLTHAPTPVPVPTPTPIAVAQSPDFPARFSLANLHRRNPVPAAETLDLPDTPASATVTQGEVVRPFAYLASR